MIPPMTEIQRPLPFLCFVCNLSIVESSKASGIAFRSSILKTDRPIRQYSGNFRDQPGEEREKSIQKVWMYLLSVLTFLSLMAPPALLQAKEAIDPPAQTSVRKEENFNRGWKFVRRDEPQAYQSDFNDANWYNVSLPHDFSIPYFMEQKFYTGIGWYRKTFEVSAESLQNKIKIDFDGVFHTIDLYVNGDKVGSHQGGYTGFEFDLSEYLHEGTNVLAAKVDNTWNPQLAPRAGDHNFTGGIYRDVKLIYENPVHVAWYGTFVQTPNVSRSSSDLRMQAEVENQNETAAEVRVRHTLLDANGQAVAQFSSSPKTIEAGQSAIFDDTYTGISKPHLWSMDDPYLYTVVTQVYSADSLVDSVQTSMGFRWCEWTADQGFFLNGEHVWLNGVNAHQDHAGWCNAVSDSALVRDVQMVKDGGFNFIRGSHYPHSPIYTQACDELGIAYWSEAAFWFIGGAGGEGNLENPGSSDYTANGYPTHVKDQAAFEDSCMQMLEEMIRIHRNHPSIMVWSMGNETFFQSVNDDSGASTNDKKRALITRMAKKCKELDPRPVQLALAARSATAMTKLKALKSPAITATALRLAPVRIQAYRTWLRNTARIPLTALRATPMHRITIMYKARTIARSNTPGEAAFPSGACSIMERSLREAMAIWASSTTIDCL